MQPPLRESTAIAYAASALRGVEDKAGRPMVDHARRVASRMETAHARIVAHLHDVVEDSAKTVEDIRREFGDEVAADVDSLSRRPGEAYFGYITRVSDASETARRVKIADIQDHLDHAEHIPASLIGRYEKALGMLRDA